MDSLKSMFIEYLDTINIDINDAKTSQIYVELFPSGAGKTHINKSDYILWPVEAHRFLLKQFNLNLMESIDGIALSIVLLENQGDPKLGLLYLPHFKSSWRFKP